MDLAQRIAALEDIDAIKRLKSRYCGICDDNYNPEAIAGLFADDAIWEGTGMGAHQGRAAIRKLFEGFREQIGFAQHNVMNPVIEVDGDRATGRWYLLQPLTYRKRNRAAWLFARYEDDYVKLKGEWKFQHVRLMIRMSAPYDKGWARND